MIFLCDIFSGARGMLKSMRPNCEYWWSTKQPQVTDLRWQLGFQWHWRGIELVFKSLDCFTKRLFHTRTIFRCYICICCCLKLHQADYKVEEFLFFLTSIWWGSTQLQCIYYLCRLLISRSPRVFRRFKHRLLCNQENIIKHHWYPLKCWQKDGQHGTCW